MSDEKQPERRRSVAAAAAEGLASEDDAAVLGEEKTISKCIELQLMNTSSQAWLQARVTPQLHHDRGIR